MPQVSPKDESVAFGARREAHAYNERREKGAAWRLVYEFKVSKYSFMEDKANPMAVLAWS